jgi:mannose-1-phosphate guanylyltransferase
VAESAEEFLVTFGVVPTTPHTGYGYLRRGEEIPGHPDVFSIVEFKEKPDRATAEEYLASGEYWWNSGMFVWRARTFLDQLNLLQPKTHDAVVELAAAPYRLSEIYPELLKISVDYAVMEPVARGEASARVAAVRLPITWHDVGGFAALGEQLPRDEHGNAIHGVSVLVDARDNLVINNAEGGRVVAVVGLTDTVIVQTSQITLVCPVAEAERIKELVAEVTAQLGGGYA